MDKKVVVYSSATCHFCHDLKDFLEEHNIAHTEYDVSVDEKRRNELIEKTQQVGVPVTYVDDEMVLGFDKPKLIELLGIEEK